VVVVFSVDIYTSHQSSFMSLTQSQLIEALAEKDEEINFQIKGALNG